MQVEYKKIHNFCIFARNCDLFYNCLFYNLEEDCILTQKRNMEEAFIREGASLK